MQPIIRRNKNKANLTDAYKAFGPQRSNNAVKLQARMLLRQFSHPSAYRLTALLQKIDHQPVNAGCLACMTAPCLFHSAAVSHCCTYHSCLLLLNALSALDTA